MLKTLASADIRSRRLALQLLNAYESAAPEVRAVFDRAMKRGAPAVPQTATAPTPHAALPGPLKAFLKARSTRAIRS